ncbi:MAG: autotransporter outer membrane beta-barrel domain-containing protein [Burkholderiaceae bacterium]|nr:autotransporter outer membrane beta-barrel domain-containing protein [Burkholderiaceae bacterium]
MKKTALRHALMWLSVPVAFGAGAAHAVEPALSKLGLKIPTGARVVADKPANDGAGRAAMMVSADYSRLQGAGLLLNETMLGTMDERLGMDAETRSTEKRIWVRLGGAYQSGGGPKGKTSHSVNDKGRGIGQSKGRYEAAALQLGGDFYRTATDRAGAFVSMGRSDFGNDVRIEGRKLSGPQVGGGGIGVYYNHANPAGWYVDTAAQISRLRGEFGQTGAEGELNADGYSSTKRIKRQDARASGTSFALQGEVGYRYAMSSGLSMTPKLRLDHHRVQLGTAEGARALGKVKYDGLSKTGVFYGVRIAQDWDNGPGKVRVWAEPGIAHTIGAKAKYSHTGQINNGRWTGEHNLNATRLALRVGVEGNLTKHQNLRLEGGMTKALGRKGGPDGAAMASWNMGF